MAYRYADFCQADPSEPILWLKHLRNDASLTLFTMVALALLSNPGSAVSTLEQILKSDGIPLYCNFVYVKAILQTAERTKRMLNLALAKCSFFPCVF